MQVLSEGKYLGQNVTQLRKGGLIITKCNYMEGLSSNWHYHENSFFTFILKGGSIEKRKKKNFFVRQVWCFYIFRMSHTGILITKKIRETSRLKLKMDGLINLA